MHRKRLILIKKNFSPTECSDPFYFVPLDEFVYFDIVANSIDVAFFISKRERIRFQSKACLGWKLARFGLVFLVTDVGFRRFFFWHFFEIPSKKVLLWVSIDNKYVYSNLGRKDCLLSNHLSFSLALYPSSNYFLSSCSWLTLLWHQSATGKSCWWPFFCLDRLDLIDQHLTQATFGIFFRKLRSLGKQVYFLYLSAIFSFSTVISLDVCCFNI